jgi:hypothetical protein
MSLEKDIKAELAIGRVPPVTHRIETSGPRFRIFLANLAIALGWSLRSSCKPSAQWPLAIARWLVPETQRFLVHHKGSHSHYRRTFKFAADLGTLLRHIPSFRVAAGLLLVLVLLGSLELGTRATAIGNQSLGGARRASSIAYKETPGCLQSPEQKRIESSDSKKNGSAEKREETDALSATLATWAFVEMAACETFHINRLTYRAGWLVSLVRLSGLALEKCLSF